MTKKQNHFKILTLLIAASVMLIASVCVGAEYKEHRGDSGDLQGYERTSDGASIPIAEGNRDYKDVVKWITGGNTPDPDDTLLDRVKQKKINEYRTEALRRIGLFVPAWDNFETIGFLASVWNMLGTPNAAQTQAKDIYVYVKNTAIPNVKAQITVVGVQVIDVVNDLNWP